MTTSSFKSQIRSLILRRLVDHWDRMRQARRMPARRDFDPLDVRYALGFLSLIEVYRQPMRFYFRLDGTKQVELFGIDCTGRFLDEAMPAQHARMAAQSYGTVVEGREPRFHRRKIQFHERIIDYEVVILPFSEDDEQVNMLLTGIVPDHL